MKEISGKEHKHRQKRSSISVTLIAVSLEGNQEKQSAWVVKWWSSIAIFHPRIINKAFIASLKTGLLKMVKWLRMALAKKGKGKPHRQEVRVNTAPP